MGITEVFWANVDWHMKNKNLVLSKTQMIAKSKRTSVTLRTVGEIAKKLDQALNYMVSNPPILPTKKGVRDVQ